MRYLALVFVCFFSCILSASAQGGPPAVGCFTIVNSAGQPQDTFCVGDPVIVVDCFPNPDPTTRVYDFGAGGGANQDTVYTYTTAGTYSIFQQGTNTNNVSYELDKQNAVTIISFPAPQFEVSACLNISAFLEITDTNYSNYQVDFGDGSAIVNLLPGGSLQHQFPASGTYTISVTATHTGSGCTETTSISHTTINTLPAPVLEKVEVLNNPGTNGTTQLTITVTAGLKYRIYHTPFPAGPPMAVDSFVATTSGPYTYVHNGVNNAQNGRYDIHVVDACQSGNAPTSNPLFSTKLSATAQNQFNSVSWESVTSSQAPIQEWRLYRNNILIDTFGPMVATYTDNNVTCGVEYCYRVEAIVDTDFLSVSNTKCVTGQSNAAPAKGGLHASFNLVNTIDVTLYTPASASFSRFMPQRSLNGQAFEPLPDRAGKVYQDWDTLATNTSYCYQAMYRDSCNNVSPLTNITCPILMEGQINQGPGIATTVNVSWTEYTGYQNGVHQYYIEILNPQGQVLSLLPAGQNLAFTDQDVTNQHQVLLYRIKAEPTNPNEPVVYSNYKKFVQEFAVNIPSAFTPNGDNLNDVFEVKGNFFSSFDLTIVSRTGQVIFQSKGDRRGWDGTVNGNPAPQDTYVYQFKGIAFSGVRVDKTGTVTLLR